MDDILFDKIQREIWGAYKRGIKREKLLLFMSRDVYESLAANSPLVSTDRGYALKSWLDFYRSYKRGEENDYFCGVRVAPAQFGTGWLLTEKPDPRPLSIEERLERLEQMHEIE